MKSKRVNVALLVALAAGVCLFGCRKDDPKPPASAPVAPPATAAAYHDAIDADHLAKARASVNAGLRFLLAGQNPDGGWGFAPGRSHPALTAMTLTALLGHPGYTPESPAVVKGFAGLMKFRQADGGFYEPDGGDKNYITSVAVMAIARGGDRYKPALRDAVKFLRGLQIVRGSKTPDGDTIGADHPFDGGVSYGKPEDNRPDLSNLGMWMASFHEAGVSGDDPAMQRALAFVKRVQSRTEGTEGQSFVIRNGADDGGFVYAIRRENGEFVAESKAGMGRRGLRSYGSMTYVGFLSMLYADVSHDDLRVQAAFDWIREHWRLDSNPNMPSKQSKQGLFYYYYVFAKALRAWDQDVITDKRGVEHNWRHELIDILAVKQAEDGSWVNSEPTWNESFPSLVTCYSVIALNEALRE